MCRCGYVWVVIKLNSIKQSERRGLCLDWPASQEPATCQINVRNLFPHLLLMHLGLWLHFCALWCEFVLWKSLCPLPLEKWRLGILAKFEYFFPKLGLRCLDTNRPQSQYHKCLRRDLRVTRCYLVWIKLCGMHCFRTFDGSHTKRYRLILNFPSLLKVQSKYFKLWASYWRFMFKHLTNWERTVKFATQWWGAVSFDF